MFALAWYITGLARALRGSKPPKIVERTKLES